MVFIKDVILHLVEQISDFVFSDYWVIVAKWRLHPYKLGHYRLRKWVVAYPASGHNLIKYTNTHIGTYFFVGLGIKY